MWKTWTWGPSGVWVESLRTATGTLNSSFFQNISNILPVISGAMSRSVLDQDLWVKKKRRLWVFFVIEMTIKLKWSPRVLALSRSTFRLKPTPVYMFSVCRINNRIILQPMAIMPQATPTWTKKHIFMTWINVVNCQISEGTIVIVHKAQTHLHTLLTWTCPPCHNPLPSPTMRWCHVRSFWWAAYDRSRQSVCL